MTPVEYLYYLGYSSKKRHVLKNRERLPYKVISIGNITVGGTGKTPTAIAVATEAGKRGYDPVILTRGYRGKIKGPCFVSDRQSILLSAEDAGDEPVIMAERLRGVPVVKAADRYEGGIFAIKHLEKRDQPFLFILDDGFQHWKIERDVDIVLVDGLNPFGNRKLLPLGPLRAPLGEIAEADVLVITKKINETVAAELRTLNDKAPVFFSHYDTDGVSDKVGNLSDISMLAGKKIYAFCGIANPESFRNTLSLSGCHLSGLKEYSDHHSYAQKDIAGVVDMAGSLGADYIITTEKDMVKIREFGRLPGNLLWLSISFRAEGRFYDEIFGRISVRNRAG